MPQLKGMTWDHLRGTAPVRAAAAEFSKRWPGVTITWQARSLKDFEDFPVEILAQDYDLMMIDHPFIGEGVKKDIFEPYDCWMSKDFLDDQRRNSVGPSYDTYHWQDRQWALAVDTAAQVAAYRPDLVTTPRPRSWDDVFALARDLPAGQRIGLPLVETHAYSSFFTLNANIAGNDFWDHDQGIREAPALDALDLLRRLAGIADPRSLDMNPIDMLDAMAADDTIVYSPLIYGYSNYARAGYARRIVRFADIPSSTAEPRGSQIGGVGLAVSRFSAHKEEAMRFAKYVASAECQTGLFYTSGGQPGYLKAWTDPAINRDCHGFFADTLATLQGGSVRPRRPGYNRFQAAAGKEIRHHLIAGGNPRKLVETFNRLYREIVERPAAA